jgi:AraC family transcriptional regulator
MSAPSTYIDHYTKGAFAPHVTERHLVCSQGVWMLDVVQPAGAFPDPPVPEFVLQRDMRGCNAAIDFGAGRFQMKAADKALVIAPPMCVSDIVVHNPHNIQILSLPTTRINKWMEGEASSSPYPDLGRLHAAGMKNILIEKLLDRLWAEAEEDRETSLLETDAVLLTLWGELLREARRPLALSSGGLAPWQVRRCTEYLHDNACENVGLEALAALVGLSPYHFARAFKHSVGVSPHQYQLQVRMKKAKELLRLTNAPVTQIAFDVGYESSQALARMFRREVGLTPSDYRRSRDK